MNRRNTLGAMLASAAAASLNAFGQTSGKMPRVRYFTPRSRGHAARLLARLRRPVLTCFHFRVAVGFLLRITPGGTRSDLCLGLTDRCQATLSPPQCHANAQAFGQRLLIGGLRARKHLFDFGFQSRFDLPCMSMRQRAVARVVGVNLGTVQRNRARLEQFHFTGDPQHQDEQRVDLFEKTLAERAQRVVVRLFVGRKVAKCDRLVGRGLNAPARVHLRRTAVDQQARRDRRAIRRRAASTLPPGQFAQVQLIDNINHEPCQAPLWQPVLHRRRQQIRCCTIHQSKIRRGSNPGIIKGNPTLTITSPLRSYPSINFRPLSPAGC